MVAEGADAATRVEPFGRPSVRSTSVALGAAAHASYKAVLYDPMSDLIDMSSRDDDIETAVR